MSCESPSPSPRTLAQAVDSSSLLGGGDGGAVKLCSVASDLSNLSSVVYCTDVLSRTLSVEPLDILLDDLEDSDDWHNDDGSFCPYIVTGFLYELSREQVVMLS
jgi:hypothetical protein